MLLLSALRLSEPRHPATSLVQRPSRLLTKLHTAVKRVLVAASVGFLGAASMARLRAATLEEKHCLAAWRPRRYWNMLHRLEPEAARTMTSSLRDSRELREEDRKRKRKEEGEEEEEEEE